MAYVKGIVITHGNLGKELITIAETILEEKIDMEFISLDWKEDGSKMLKKVEYFLEENKKNDVIIFTDMFGGSPTNICFKFNRKNVEIVTGINLTGILKFLTYRKKNIDVKELAQISKKGAIDDLNIISEYLGERKA